MRIRRPLAPFACVLAAVSASAALPQGSQPKPAPLSIPGALDSVSMESITLILPPAPQGELDLTVPIEGRDVRIVLRPDSSRSPELEAARARRIAREAVPGRGFEPLPPPRTMRGFVVGNPQSVVSASLENGQISALIHDFASRITYVVEPSPLGQGSSPVGVDHVTYRFGGTPIFQCGCGLSGAATSLGRATGAPSPGPTQSEITAPLSALNGPIRDLPLVLDTTSELFAAWGLDEAAMLVPLEAMLHHASVLYEAQLGIRLRLYDYVPRIDGNAAGYPYLPLDNYVLGAHLALAAQPVWYPGNQVMPWKYASVITPSAIGLAGGTQEADVCRRMINGNVGGDFRATSFSSMPTTSSFARNTLVFAHELGHGFRLYHDVASMPDQAATGLMHPYGSDGFFFSQPDLGYIDDWFAMTEDCYLGGTPSFGAPVVSSVTPATQVVFPDGEVALQGFELDGTYKITAGSITLDYHDFTLQGSQSLLIHDLRSFDVGTTTCMLHSVGGTATFDITLTAVATPALVVDSRFHPFGSTVSLSMWGAPQGMAFGIFSLAPTQTTILGWPILINRQPTTSTLQMLDARGHHVENWHTGSYPANTTIWMQFAEYQSGLGFTGTSNLDSFTVQ